jgi:hypothetical protein
MTLWLSTNLNNRNQDMIFSELELSWMIPLDLELEPPHTQIAQSGAL